MAKKHPVSHIEWVTKNGDRLQKFYGAVFNWKFSDSGMPGYTMVNFGNKDVGGGMFSVGDQQMPTGVTNYFNVDELAPHEEAIKAGGGQVMRSNQEIPGIGWFSIGIDPDGNPFAMWKQAPKPSKKEKKKAKKAAKDAKKQAQKAKKDAKKQAEKAKKEAEKAQKAQKKAQKDQTKAQKEPKAKK